MDYEISSQQAHMRGSVWGVQPGFSLSLSLSLSPSLSTFMGTTNTNGKIECSEVLRADTFRVFVRATVCSQKRKRSQTKTDMKWRDIL